MAEPLTYATLERIQVPRPADRLGFIANLRRDRRVLDIGCLDETALQTRSVEQLFPLVSFGYILRIRL
ncbi:hypothetical protein U5A82_17640 [Sphingobium sp. CR2-8]|uniref:hypothetical protein n=1 Tax=Sphingobium sp. CR2-8 TaxID=1306534 RepID=UPI002DBA155A|nr:hypothetical protein [Sphingobium sp. CR2-8]MEC3912232.1 hypothetical protein [Sphingobium sp. CR2-8]